MNISRHGDLGITPIDKIPDEAKKMYTGNSYVLAEGEYTGHKHLLQTKEREGFNVFISGNDLFLEMLKPAKLSHEEHKTIEIEIGTYKINRENEYDPFLRQIRQVQD